MFLLNGVPHRDSTVVDFSTLKTVTVSKEEELGCEGHGRGRNT